MNRDQDNRLVEICMKEREQGKFVKLCHAKKGACVYQHYTDGKPVYLCAAKQIFNGVKAKAMAGRNLREISLFYLNHGIPSRLIGQDVARFLNESSKSSLPIEILLEDYKKELFEKYVLKKGGKKYG